MRSTRKVLPSSVCLPGYSFLVIPLSVVDRKENWAEAVLQRQSEKDGPSRAFGTARSRDSDPTKVATRENIRKKSDTGHRFVA